MRLPIFVLCFLFVGVGFTQQTQPWDKEPTGYRDIAFGSPESEVQAKIMNLECSGETVCMGKFSIGDYPVENMLLFHDGQFGSAYLVFDSDSYAGLRDIFIEKYGEPHTKESNQIQNRMGATFENESLTWEGKNALVVISRYSDKVTEGTATIVSKAYLKATQGDETDKKKKAADDF